MAQEFEAIGTLAEGSMAGRSFEKRDGEAPAGGDHPEECLNCGTPLIGPHCHACGQPGHVHRSISAFWHDILHAVLHFDGKFWNTLPLLAWKPGELTRRYVHGERARFISPMALFLFSIFLMFAIFSFVGPPSFSGGGENSNFASTPGETWQDGIRGEIAQTEGKITETETKLAQRDLDAETIASLEKDLLDQKAAVNGMSFAISETPPYSGIDNAIVSASPDVMDGAPKWLAKAAKKANKNPELLLYKLQSNGYKFAWLLIPLSIPFVWLVTIGKRGHRFYDHAVFTTYSLAFMSLLFIACVLSVKLNLLPGLVIPVSLLYAPFHLYRQLRHAYAMSRFGTVLRLVALIVFITITLALFLVILVALGLLG